MNKQRTFTCSIFCGLILLGLFCSSATAQVFDTGPSDPALFDSVADVSTSAFVGVIDNNAPGGNTSVIGGGGSTSQVNVSAGGILNQDFEVDLLSGTELNVSGGSVPFFVTALPGSEVNVSGGSIGNGGGGFSADESLINLSGGTIIGSPINIVNSQLNFTGGNLGVADFVGSEVNASGDSNFVSGFSTSNGSVVNISDDVETFLGLTVNDSELNVSGGLHGIFQVGSGSVANISGGDFNATPSLSLFTAFANSETNLFGSDFVLDGVPLDPSLTIGSPLTISSRDVTLTGVFVDGTPFSFDLDTAFAGGDVFDPDATLTVTLVGVPEPSSLTLLGLGSLILLGRRRRQESV